MKSKSKKIFLLFVPVFAVMFLGALEVGAQVGGGCDVSAIDIRHTRPLGPAFFSESNPPRPYVYLDVTTQNCTNESIQISITEDDFGLDPDDDVNGTLGDGQTCDNGNNSCMDNRIININNTTTNQFTLALIAGEDECGQELNDSDCQYHIETWDEGNTVMGLAWNESLEYECSGGCDINWQYLGIILFGTTHASDPDADTENPGGGTTGDENPGGGTTTTSGGSTVINLNLPNPLAGTVDTLPEFFQKVVYIIIKIGVPLVAMAIVFAGFLFVTARGSDEQLKKAKLAFTFAIIGGLILLASWAVADAIKDALTTINNP